MYQGGIPARKFDYCAADRGDMLISDPGHDLHVRASLLISVIQSAALDNDRPRAVAHPPRARSFVGRAPVHVTPSADRFLVGPTIGLLITSFHPSLRDPDTGG